MKLIKLVLAFVLLFTFLSSKTASAEKNINNLSPNLYEKKDRNNNTDFFTDEPLNEQKTPIPEEQKSLTFKMKPDEKWENIKGELFAEGSGEEKSTVAQKAKQLHLFSGKNSGQFLNRTDETKETSQSALPIVYIILIALGVLMIVLLILPGMRRRNEDA
ncbi:type VII secretion protein EssA [Fictibacillus aquaticus]|nr:type VII secretion protein EssA [Fictibacillus aquaticus]